MKRRAARRSTKRTAKKGRTKKKIAKTMSRKVRTKKMAFATGDRVKILVDAADVKAGTLGTVTEPVPATHASRVRFDGRTTPLLVPNENLELA